MFGSKKPYKIKALYPGGVMYIVVSSPPATLETGAMGREVESRQCIYCGSFKNPGIWCKPFHQEDSGMF
jgi:hypothetical protein